MGICWHYIVTIIDIIISSSTSLRDNTSKAKLILVHSLLLHTVSFYFRDISSLLHKNSFGLNFESNLKRCRNSHKLGCGFWPIHENNGSIIRLLSIYGNNRTIICPQLSSSQRGRIWDEIGDLITLGTHFLRPSLLRMITLEDYKVESCQILEDRRMSSDGRPSANRNKREHSVLV